MPPSTARHHAEWLSLIEVSGPFLSLPVLLRVFPQGLDADDTEHARDLRLAFEEWQDNQLGLRPRLDMHKAWIDFVLRQTLQLPDAVIGEGQGIPQTLRATISEHRETLRPDILIKNPEGGDDPGKPRLLIQTYPLSQDLEKPVLDRRWKASPDTRMTELLHATDVQLGLVTNGERWMLVFAPRGETTGYASWYASLWLEERLTLRALRSLLGVHRFFAVANDATLGPMLAESAANQHEVTDQLGLQVRHAVEVLVQSLDRADQDRGRRLLAGVPETALYEAALTVMMRLVFLFCAEERGLLLLGDLLYDENYAVSTLGDQLQAEADEYGEEVLERRPDAWCRLLSTFRMVYGGVRHDRVTLPAYAGGLFDPDRFPFLEGRPEESTWRQTPADPLPVNNRTVLHLLRSLQYLQMQVSGRGPAEPRRLSFRALDIEQIGHVYEGLLDHTAKRALEPVLGLQGAKGREPEIPLSTLEQLRDTGEDELIEFLKRETGRSQSALTKALQPNLESHDGARLAVACGNEAQLLDRIQPFAGLLRDDNFGYPVVVGQGSVYVTSGTDRRSSGTHYTPRSLTEPIVQYTLEPLVYLGPADGKPKDQWKLRAARELLDLKICDMACGSGAFLVQACRYLSERVVEAWEEAESRLSNVPGITPFGQPASGAAGEAIIPKDTDERMAYARRLVAQRCLYGVDINPLAVEMAKLSLWLLTVAKNKPFTFLDHAIRPGDSLVGIRDLDQIKHFNLDGQGQQNRLILDFLRDHVQHAVELRRQIEQRPADTVHDVEAQEDLMHRAEDEMARLTYAADMLIAADFQGTTTKERAAALTENSIEVAQHFSDSDPEFLRHQAHEALGGRPTFHWPLEFPEVMVERGGFDGVIGNPPYLGGTVASEFLTPQYMWALQRWEPPWHGKADLVVGFLKRATRVLAPSGSFSFVTTSAVLRGETFEAGLSHLLQGGWAMYYARPPYKWPGTAQVEVVNVSFRRFWMGCCWLDDLEVPGISPDMTAGDPAVEGPHKLPLSSLGGYLGVKLCPQNRPVDETHYQIIIRDDPVLAEAYVLTMGGEEIASLPDLGLSPRAVDPARLAELASAPGLRSASSSGLWVPSLYAHAAPAKELMDTLRTSALAFACGETMVHLGFVRVATSGVLIKHKAVVFPADTWATFTMLQSVLHTEWAWRWGLRREARIVYSPKRCARTFPLPSLNDHLGDIGETYHEHRRQVMLDRWEGLTKTYNRFHDDGETAADIARLRELHVQMDYAVATAYGWDDLDLGHDFHETKQGLRYTISDPARREVLDRLLQLNHDRYEEEVRQGLHEKKKGRKQKTKRSKKQSPPSRQQSLFDSED